MPLPEKYRRQLMESTAAAERAARGDGLRMWARVLGGIVSWTVLGLSGIFIAFHTVGHDIGMIWWWAGSIAWVAGVSAAVLGAYRRGMERGDL
jgi:hypothetical protein